MVGGSDHAGGEGDDLPGQLGGLAPVGRLLHSAPGLSHPNKTKLQMIYNDYPPMWQPVGI